jgi:hypothetical protein
VFVNPNALSPAAAKATAKVAAGAAADDDDDGDATPDGKAKAAAKAKKIKAVAKITETEKLERGSVPVATYWKYIRASGTWTMLLGVVGGQVFFNVVQGVSNWWLGYW